MEKYLIPKISNAKAVQIIKFIIKRRENVNVNKIKVCFGIYINVYNVLILNILIL